MRFSYIESFHYLLIEESLFTLISLASKEVSDGEIVKYLNKNASSDLQTAYNIFKIVERLAWLQVYFTNNKNVYTNSMIKFLLSKMKIILEALEEPSIFNSKSSDSSILRKERELVIAKMLSGKIGDFYARKDPAIEKAEPLSFSIVLEEVGLKGP